MTIMIIFLILILIVSSLSFQSLLLSNRRSLILLSKGGGLLPAEKLINIMVYNGMTKEVASDIITQKAEKALKSWTQEYTEFLEPIEVKSLVEAFKELLDVKLAFQGGYTQSVRKRCFISRNDDYTDPIDDNNIIDDDDDDDKDTKKAITLKLNEYTDNIEEYMTAIRIEGNFLFDRATYDDFQTAIMTTGVSKTQIGDIILLPNDKGAQIIITPDVTLKIISSLKQMRTVPVTVEEIELKDISKRMAQVKEITCIEASTRLDAIASAVFNLSRSKTVKSIDNNAIMVNWKVQTNSAYSLKKGEEISMKDGGKFFIANIETTAKGRYRITAQRFL